MPVAELTKKRHPTDPWDVPTRFVNPDPIVHTKNVNLLLYAQAYMWFHRVADFREAEMMLFYRTNPSKTIRSQHRRIIQMLIEQGNELVRRIHAKGGLVKAENGFSIEDIESAIEELGNTLLQWYGGMSKKRKEEILAQVFDAS
jgi:hypothetical protein